MIVSFFVLIGQVSILHVLIPLMFSMVIFWIIFKVLCPDFWKEDDISTTSATVATGHPATNVQALPASQSPVATEDANKPPIINLPIGILPERDYFRMDQSAINYYWDEAFYKNLEFFTGTNITSTDGDHGLIYYYVIDGQVRYIGQIRENTLKWRLNQPQAERYKGYNLYIQRNMLQAASEGRLNIQIRRVLKAQLDQCEKAEIEAYAPTKRLWNQEHNPHFQKENFYNS